MMRQNWADIEDDPVPTLGGHQKWADADDDPEELIQHGNSITRTAPNEKGIRTEIEYTERFGKAVKVTTKYQQKLTTKKSNVFVESRRTWGGFGKCVDPQQYSEYGSNRPVRAEEEVRIDQNKEKQMKALGQEEKFWETSIQLCEGILNDAKKKKYDANEMRRRKEICESEQAERTQRIVATGGPQSTLAGKYVPPSMRGGAAGPVDNRNENTLRVMNLSEDTREGDLQNLFATCGRVTRVFMPKHKEGEKEGQHKGFAFVAFADRKDGERAMKKLNGHGYDSLILQVSWAQPKAL